MLAIVPLRKFPHTLLTLAVVLLLGTPCPAAESRDEPPPITSQAAGIYAQARQRIMQIRTLVTNTSQQSSLGSGFFVSADGIAVTNYHVVSEYALEPKSYNLEYVTTDDRHGSLKLLAIDVINDLAIVKADLHDQPYFEFDDLAVKGNLTKGTRLFAMGNPLNLGFTIVEGTYNGLIDHSDIDRIHFTGAINAGKSGGPVVTAGNRLAGINVAKNVEDAGELPRSRPFRQRSTATGAQQQAA
jgi:S1-C subfamily serine protease